jgi:hypothetical protein
MRMARKGAQRGRYTRKIYRGGDPVNTQALITSLTTGFNGFRQVLQDNGILQPLLDIFTDLRFIAFSPVVVKEVMNAAASLRTNGTVAAAIIDALTVMGVRGVNQPGIIQILQTLQTQYNILSKPAVQETITSIGSMVRDIVSRGDVPNALGTIGATTVTNILADSQINNLVNDIILKLNSISANRTINNVVTQVASTPQISSGPSAATEAAAAAAREAAALASLSTTGAAQEAARAAARAIPSATTTTVMNDEERRRADLMAAREATVASEAAALASLSTAGATPSATTTSNRVGQVGQVARVGLPPAT